MKIKMVLKMFSFLALTAMIFMAGCTTAIYGHKPELIDQQHNTYTFKIYTGGFAGGGTADKRAKEEFEKFEEQNNFSSYKILERHYDLVPSGFRYTVSFSR